MGRRPRDAGRVPPHGTGYPARKGLENRMSRRGNPNWGKPNVPVPRLLSEFEQQVEKLGLRPNQYQASPELRKWCRRNANIHYVPEDLLSLWRIEVNENWGPTTGAMLYGRRLDMTS
jgi:hypothetical protein